MSIVIDTNVLLDGADDDNSFANKIIDEVLAGKLEAFANSKTAKENRFIVRTNLNKREYREKLERYFAVLKYTQPVRVDVQMTDNQDKKLLSSALSAGAEYLITSDWDLLRLEENDGVKIVTPQAFWNIYRQEVLGENDWKKFIKDFLN